LRCSESRKKEKAMEMETKKKNRSKPGVLDAVIVILIIIAALFALYFLFGKGAIAGGGETKRISFSVELRKMDPQFVENIKVGEKIYDNEKGYYLGTIAGYESSEHEVITPVPDLDSGVKYAAKVPGFLDVRIIIEGDAVVTSQSTTISDSLIAVGEIKYVRSKSLAGKGYIVSVDLGGGQND
jgi:hypothetical protein